MKKIFAILVCVCACVTSAFADDYIKVNGVTLTVNDDGVVLKTNMNEFKEVKFLQAFKVSKKQTSDWADVMKDSKGNYYVVVTDMNLKVSGRTVKIVESVGDAEYLSPDSKEFVGVGTPLGNSQYKWIWAYHKKAANDPGDLYIVIYGK